MSKLNQIIAIEKGIKSRVYSDIGELHKAIQKPDLFNGVSRTYKPKDESDEMLPPESKRVQFHAPEVLRAVERLQTELLEVTARKDWTNCTAKADVVVDDNIIIADAPVTYLLFLEKQITDLKTFIGCLPTLDESDDWTKDANLGLFKTAPTQTHRTKKIPKAIVLYPATPEHPAQTQMVTEDIIAGFWETVKQSGAMPKPEKQKLQAKAEKLLNAVKEAREAANNEDEIEAPKVGGAIFSYLFA